MIELLAILFLAAIVDLLLIGGWE